jgi:hypothetical protein
MPTTQAAVHGGRPNGTLERRAFGVQDRPPCPSCCAEMHLVRRSPEPRHNNYEVQIFSCIICDAEITRTVDCRGRPHGVGVLIELETAASGIARRNG